MNGLRWSLLGLFAVTIAAGLWLQRHAGRALEAERALLEDSRQELAWARAENARLKATETPPEELARLRADRAAMARLRLEIETLRTQAERQERAAAATPANPPTPAVEMRIHLAADGSFALADAPANLEGLEQRFAGLAQGDAVKIRVTMPDMEKGASVRFDEARRTMKAIADLAKQRGLHFEMTMERATR